MADTKFTALVFVAWDDGVEGLVVALPAVPESYDDGTDDDKDVVVAEEDRISLPWQPISLKLLPIRRIVIAMMMAVETSSRSLDGISRHRRFIISLFFWLIVDCEGLVVVS